MSRPKIVTKITKDGRTVNYLMTNYQMKIISGKEADRLIEEGKAEVARKWIFYPKGL